MGVPKLRDVIKLDLDLHPLFTQSAVRWRRLFFSFSNNIDSIWKVRGRKVITHWSAILGTMYRQIMTNCRPWTPQPFGLRGTFSTVGHDLTIHSPSKTGCVCDYLNWYWLYHMLVSNDTQSSNVFDSWEWKAKVYTWFVHFLQDLKMSWNW